MPEYTNNSYAHKAAVEAAQKKPEKKLEPVISGGSKEKEKSGLSKFKDEMISEDAKNVKSYIIKDVLLPAAKKAISDIVTNGIDMILYGEKRHQSRSRERDTVSYKSYYNSERSRHDDRFASRGSESNVSSTEIWFETRADADAVIDAMYEILNETEYDAVSINDFRELAKLPRIWTGENYGWTNIDGHTIKPCDGGWLIRMPRPKSL